MTFELSGVDPLTAIMVLFIGLMMLILVGQVIVSVVEAFTKLIRTWIVSNARVKIAQARAQRPH
jgi:hypothetical protein